MENQPQNIIAIGRKRFPIEEIALVEPFEPPAEPSPRFTSDKDFKARVVLIDRYNVLTEDTVEAFAEANKFRRLNGSSASIKNYRNAKLRSDKSTATCLRRSLREPESKTSKRKRLRRISSLRTSRVAPLMSSKCRWWICIVAAGNR